MSSMTKVTLPPHPGGTEEQVLMEERVSGDKLYVRGKTVPTDATAGYAKGCIFVDIDAAAGNVFWINEGSATSCDFNEVGAIS